MIRKLAAGALLLVSLGVMNAQAQTVLLSTLPASGGTAYCTDTAMQVAIGVKNPTDAAYKIGSAKATLYRSNPLIGFTFTLYNDDSGKPGSPIAEFGTAPGQAGLPRLHEDILSMASPVTLSPLTSYWIVASASNWDHCGSGWVLSELMTPAGLLTNVSTVQRMSGLWELKTNPVGIELLALSESHPDTPLAPVASTSSEALTINWSAPADNGSPITKYTVTGVPSGSCTTEIVAPATEPATSCTISGLTNGTPYKFTVVATNANGDSAPSLESAEAIPSADLAFVGAGANITLAGGVVAAAYSQPLQVTGGLPPYTFSVVGDLPPGLAIDSATGVVSGTPTTPGTYSFSVMAMDSAVQPELAAKAVHVAEQTFTIVITAAPVVQATPTPVPALGGLGLLLLSGAVAGSMGLMRRRKSN